eukprot:TRINITY_DN11211_c0_g1_i1.p1 TRINITY_DN11211_c0_g1~~TRINITY_DN11211_c0_g1_i1.p1  ORF type:complete len:320 (+),score=64.11 TRINITY_DN11211_c0_g1_i1:450-1409(+)
MVQRLKGKRQVEKVMAEQKMIATLHKQSCDVLTAALAQSEGTPLLAELATLPLPEWRRWYCCVCSRGFYFDIDSSRGDVWTLMPWLDYFNYTDGTGHSAELNKRTGCFEVVLRADVQKGEQVLLHYGTYCNFELLLWYGFALVGCNANQVYKLSPLSDATGNLPTGVEWLQELLRLLASHPPPDLGSGCWEGVDEDRWRSMCELWASAAALEIAEAGGANDWWLKNDGVSPPSVSSSMRLMVKALSCTASATTSDLNDRRAAGILRALCVTEYVHNWEGEKPARPPECVIEAVGEEQRAVLSGLTRLPPDAWVEMVKSS